MDGHSDLFEVWYDRDLLYDEAWQKQILGKIETCDGIVIMAAPEYLSREKKFVHEQEIPSILKRFQDDHLPVSCLMVKRVDVPILMNTLSF